ncbi:MAG TPA: hypothetical protein VHF50_04940 [Solirubrobacterales bacterium]|nr:hypothetical protein [Solirubrobacterales bacterium]
MSDGREAQLAWEERWARPAAAAALAAVIAVIASIVVAQTKGSADGASQILMDIDGNNAAVLISSALQAIGIALLALPLLYLFRAADFRSETMRSQLVGVVIAGPLFLAVAFLLTGIVSVQAAGDFVADEVPRLAAKGVELGSDRANEVADDTLADAGLRPLATGFGIGGQIGFIVAMFYTALHAMRTGLLSRFWGSLGMALGAVSFLFFQFALLWFVYLGLLLAGWIPGGKPPAWESGEAEPWPTPGERAAQAMESDAEKSRD